MKYFALCVSVVFAFFSTEYVHASIEKTSSIARSFGGFHQELSFSGNLCRNDGDCGGTEYCAGGYCVIRGGGTLCRDDGDCGGTEYCAGGYCVIRR